MITRFVLTTTLASALLSFASASYGQLQPMPGESSVLEKAAKPFSRLLAPKSFKDPFSGGSSLGSSSFTEVLKFPSSATVKVPLRMKGKLEGKVASFTLGSQPLDIHIIESKTPLAEAMTAVKKALYPYLLEQEPIDTQEPEPGQWDTIKTEAFGPDNEQRYVQLNSFQKGEYTWSMVFRGTQEVFASSSEQLLFLQDSLRVPGIPYLDLSKKTRTSITERAAELDSFLTKAIATAEVPGLAIAVIEDGKVVYKKGFGQLGLNDPAPVTADTMFMIGSTTKSMTTLMISQLADQGRLSWDDKVVDIYPDFKLGDEALTAKVTLADLVCACSGIPRHDLPMLYSFKGKNSKNVLAELKFLKPTKGYRESFLYSNQLVAAAGYIAAKKALPDTLGSDGYQQLMSKQVFKPLKMTRTLLDFDRLKSMANVAKPHSMNLDGTYTEIDLNNERFLVPVAPAGAIWSSVNDMAHYMIAELDGGVYDGKRIVSEEGLHKRRQPQVQMASSRYYGLSWIVGESLGLEKVEHGGATLGNLSEFVFFPKTRSGFIILSNSRSVINMPTIDKLLELWYDVPFQAEESLALRVKKAKQQMAEVKALTFKPTAEFMKPYLGKHHHPEVGDVEILVVDGKYFLKTSTVTSMIVGVDDGVSGKMLMTASSPAIGVAIIPVFKGGVSIQIANGPDDVYSFKPVAP